MQRTALRHRKTLRRACDGALVFLAFVFVQFAADVVRAQTAPLEGVVAVAAGEEHSCALTTAGGVKCWGDNEWGQLGTGGDSRRLTPVDVPGLTSGVSQIAAGDYHTCAILIGGRLTCWGKNQTGQLGDGTLDSRKAPVDVLAMGSDVIAVRAAYAHTCALMTWGGVKCWGENKYGKLGDGTITNRSRPTDVVGLGSGVAAISAGSEHTCALLLTGRLKCWGENLFGQLGDGSFSDRLLPVDVLGLDSGVELVVAGGLHTCAVTRAAAAMCWGGNGVGSVGDGTTTNRSRPTPVLGLGSGVRDVAAGDNHSCALLANGGLKCWGYNPYGQVGDSSLYHRYFPVDVIGLTQGVRSVLAGGDHTCAITDSARLYCWGYNPDGRLGDNSTSFRKEPVAVGGGHRFQAVIAAGTRHSCAVSEAGGAMCWGDNAFGQLGDGLGLNRVLPIEVDALPTGVTKISAGALHACALASGGTALCWGSNTGGQLGDGGTTTGYSPQAVRGLEGGVLDIAAGGAHTCAIRFSGGVKCWGSNWLGQLGDGSTVGRLEPTEVSGLAAGVIQVVAGGRHSCALLSSGAAMCWGDNDAGQLGDGTGKSRRNPVQVLGLSTGVVMLAAGSAHTCAVLVGGEAKCWGANISGQIGDNSGLNQAAPASVLGLDTGVVQIAAGGTHSCAIMSSGAVKCWGGIYSGQSALGASGDSGATVEVFGPSSGAIALALGDQHSCVALAGGSVQCWGGNTWGELGDGTALLRPVPQYVLFAPTTEVDVVEFYNSQLNHYFQTASGFEAAGIDRGDAGPGWSRTGQSLLAYSVPMPQTQGVCRFYGTPGIGPNSHFYTIDPGECEWVKTDPGWTYEGIAFYAFPPVAGSCPADKVPVKRAYNQRWAQNDSNHRFYVYLSALPPGWLSEGIVMCALSSGIY